MAASIKGGFMGDKDGYKIDSLFLMGEDGTKIPLEENALISNENLSEDLNKPSGLLGEYKGIPVIIKGDIGFMDKRYLYKVVYGISNNYLKMHGRPMLRERTRYKWYRERQRKKDIDD